MAKTPDQTDSTSVQASTVSAFDEPGKHGEEVVSAGSAGTDGLVASSGTGGLMLKPRPFSLTMPPPDDYFFVREGQLDALTKGDKDYSLEISLASAGGAIGFSQNLFTTIGNMISDKAHDNIDLMLAFLALGLIVLAGAKFIESYRTSSDVKKLKTAVKSGQKFKVEE